MPMVTTTVDRVRERPVQTWKGRRVKYDVYVPQGVYETWDVLKASLCDRASKTGRAVRLGLKDSRFGPEIVSAEFAETGEAA